MGDKIRQKIANDYLINETDIETISYQHLCGVRFNPILDIRDNHSMPSCGILPIISPHKVLI